MTQALVPYSPHETGQVLHDGLVVPERHRFGRACCLLVRADAGAVEERHPKLHATLLHQRKQAVPHPEPRPTDEGLGGHPPGAVLGGYGAPFGAIVVPPQDRAHRAPQVAQRNFRRRANRLDQGFKHQPLRVRQHSSHPA